MITGIRKPYLLLIGDMASAPNAKTAFGLRDWCRDDCLGQLRFTDDSVDLGLKEMTVGEAVAAGAKTLVIGITPSGGQLPESWHPTLVEAVSLGLDIASGLHQRLKDIAALANKAQQHGRQLHDVRHTDQKFPVGDGKKRRGKRLLTVGTDCALGKKYTALALAKAMQEKGMPCNFRGTGQTGILISGSGVSIDAVVADFIAGAAETLSPDNDPGHWDVIEGQGSLMHPAYAGVSLGLLHGSQPDALILCHDPWRETIHNLPHIPITPMEVMMELVLTTARLTNPAARFVGVSLNTSKAFDDQEAQEIIASFAEETGLPCVDPIRTGVDSIVAELECIQ